MFKQRVSDRRVAILNYGDEVKKEIRVILRGAYNLE